MFKLLSRRYIALTISFIFLILLAACGESASESPQNISEVNLEALEVEIIAPEKEDPDTEIVLQALVTQGDEKVNDASEVLYEVWQQGQKEESDFVEAVLTDEDGVYEITYHFVDENLYYIQPHVTARGTHVMPVGEIEIGEDFEIVEEDHDEHNENRDH